MLNKTNKECIAIIWFDSNIHSYDRVENINERLREINDYAILYDEIKSCIDCIQSIEKEKILLITSSSDASEILSQITSLDAIDAIFIFDFDNNQKEKSLFAHSKLIGTYTVLENLYLSIQEQVDLINELVQTFAAYDQFYYSIQDLSKQTSDLFWFQLLNPIILQLPRDQITQKEMIDFCRQYYEGNSNELKLIDDFQHDYRRENAIEWYLKKSFISKLIKKALQTKNFDQLNSLRYFMSDLTETLVHQHLKKIQIVNENMTVYRGIKLLTGQLDQ